MDEPDLIRDIPRYREALEQARNLQSFKSAMPILRPVLRLFKVDTDSMDESLLQVEDLTRKIDQLATMPDRFNDLFSKVGWISYDDLNVDVAMAAIEAADKGDFDGAEQLLVAHYDVDRVRMQLRRMYAVEAFRPRMRLAELALEDYGAGRYHSSILVVFTLLDGMVNEVGKQNRGFFAQGVDLSAWNSIAGHNKGLKALAAIFSEGRKKTRTDSITIPYRNGIMHGMDLGYDNMFVAAKVWAALFAAREWALKVQQGTHRPSPPDPRPGLLDTFKKIEELEQSKRRLKAWKPRPVRRGEDIPNSEAEAFEDGTPEKRLAEFLACWRRGNYGCMAECISALRRISPTRQPAEVREVYHEKKLLSFALTEIEDQAAAATEIAADLVVEFRGQQAQRTTRFRMICEGNDGHGEVRGTPGGRWTIMNWDMPGHSL